MTLLLAFLLTQPAPRIECPPEPIAVGDTVLVTRTENVEGINRYVHEGHGRVVRIDGSNWQVEGWDESGHECGWWLWNSANMVRVNP